MHWHGTKIWYVNPFKRQKGHLPKEINANLVILWRTGKNDSTLPNRENFSMTSSFVASKGRLLIKTVRFKSPSSFFLAFTSLLWWVVDVCCWISSSISDPSLSGAASKSEPSFGASDSGREEDLIRLSRTFLETSASASKSCVLLFSASKSSSALSVSSRSLLSLSMSAPFAFSSPGNREIKVSYMCALLLGFI